MNSFTTVNICFVNSFNNVLPFTQLYDYTTYSSHFMFCIICIKILRITKSVNVFHLNHENIIFLCKIKNLNEFPSVSFNSQSMPPNIGGGYLLM